MRKGCKARNATDSLRVLVLTINHYNYRTEPLRVITTTTAFTLRGINTITATKYHFYGGLLLHVGAKFVVMATKSLAIQAMFMVMTAKSLVNNARHAVITTVFLDYTSKSFMNQA